MQSARPTTNCVGLFRSLKRKSFGQEVAEIDKSFSFTSSSSLWSASARLVARPAATLLRDIRFVCRWISDSRWAWDTRVDRSAPDSRACGCRRASRCSDNAKRNPPRGTSIWCRHIRDSQLRAPQPASWPRGSVEWDREVSSVSAFALQLEIRLLVWCRILKRSTQKIFYFDFSCNECQLKNGNAFVTYTPFDCFVDRLTDRGHVQARVESESRQNKCNHAIRGLTHNFSIARCTWKTVFRVNEHVN